MKKVNGKSMILGMVLCAVLVLLIGSKPVEQPKARQAGTDQKLVTLNELWDKCELIDQRVLVVSGKLNQLEEKLGQLIKMTEKVGKAEGNNTAMAEELHSVLKSVRFIEKALEKK